MAVLDHRPRRRLAPLLGLATLVLAILGGATFVSRRVIEAPAPRRPPAPRAAAAPAASIEIAALSVPFSVAAADGKVEAFREGRWVPIKRGDSLTVQDVVRTGPGAHAVLRRGSAAEVELREKVDVRLDRFSSDTASLDVLRGKVVANVSRQGESLEITARDTKSSNEGIARFVVAVDETGNVAVASTEGTTRFAAQGKEVKLTEGTQSEARPGRAPSDPERIPESVFLSVVWPVGERREDKVPVHGQAKASTSIKINNVDAEVGADGKFVAWVPLREGQNRIEVAAEDLTGRTRNEATVVRRHSKAPALSAEPEELWKK